ncbi:hypothetical protein M404DRAFT_31408 [Pisolithus tinctorius Marx 270]|uniref:Uncharacterized protein n=1 Tax=Pisolithus tinctorius Marx 270 TaxID=870435 RepID=A0A0C3NSD1_PISTI|nr:hypothetical protein M404DRAFT_31408 [Pisolithus tinctorius Marx 270]
MSNVPSAVPGQSAAPVPTMLTNPPPAPTLTIPPLPIGASPVVAMPHPPKTPQPQSRNPGSQHQQALAAYMLLSPSSKASIDTLIDAKHAHSSASHWSTVKLPICFDLDEQAPVVTPDGNAISISSHIDNLADVGYHIPLSLFTYESLCKLQNKHHSMKITKIYQKNQKVYVLNISWFPKESDMCPLDWYLAWDPT